MRARRVGALVDLSLVNPSQVDRTGDTRARTLERPRRPPMDDGVVRAAKPRRITCTLARPVWWGGGEWRFGSAALVLRGNAARSLGGTGSGTSAETRKHTRFVEVSQGGLFSVFTWASLLPRTNGLMGKLHTSDGLMDGRTPSINEITVGTGVIDSV